MGKINILLVGDQQDNLPILTSFLEPFGENVIQANSREEVLLHVTERDLAVVVFDTQVQSPIVFETVDLLHRREHVHSIPILFLAPHDFTLPEVFENYPIGMVDYLIKPVAPERLRARIGSYLELFRRTQALHQQVIGLNNWSQTALKSIGDAVLATDNDGRVTFLNPNAEALTSWSQAEALGKDVRLVFNIINEHTRQPADNPIDRVLREGIVVGLANHTVLVAKDGKEIPIDDSGAPIHGPANATIGAILVFRDVSEQRRVQRLQAQLAAIVESSEDAIISYDLDGIITSWNTGAEHLYGYMTEGIVGKPVSLLIPPDQPDDMLAILEHIKRGERVKQYETKRLRKDGAVFDVSLTVSPIRDKDGIVIGASKITRDITERKQNERQLGLLYDAEQQARSAAEKANQRLVFLSHASQLLSSSLDYDATFNNLKELILPDLADIYSIDVIQEDQTLQRVAVAAVDPTVEAWVRELETRSDLHTLLDVPDFAAGKSMFLETIPPTLFESVAQDPDHLALLQKIDATSEIIVPLRIRETLTGILTVVRRGSRPAYTNSDVVLMEELARQVAQAVDNARLYRHAQNARQLAERLADRANRLQRVTSELSNLLRPSDMAQAILEQCLGVVDAARRGLVVMLAPDGEWLDVVNVQGYDADNTQPGTRIPMSNAALPIVYSVSHREPLFLNSREQWRLLAPEAPDLMTNASLALVPLLVEDRVIGALVLSYDEAQSFSPEDRSFILGLAQQCAQAFERARLYEAEQQARAKAESGQRQLAFLAQASELLATSLDYQTTLTNIGQLSVPAIADWCTIHIVQSDGSVSQILTYHNDPARVQLAENFRRRYPANSNASTGVYNVLRTGRSEFNPEVPDELLAKVVTDPEQLHMLREFGFRSGMLVPLMVRGKPMGVLQFIAAESARKYSPQDLAFAEELARRASSAIENSLLFQQVQEQRERLRVTLASIGDAVIATDQRGLVTFMNPVAEALTEWPQSDAAGKPLDEVFKIINETTRQTVESPVEKVLREGAIVGLANHTLLITKEGQAIPIDDSGAPIRTQEGLVAGVILVFRDITERRQIERERLQLLEHERQARVAVQAANQKLQFLTRVSTVLVSSIDYDRTLANLAQLLVPQMADNCVIDLITANESLTRVAVAATDPVREEALRELARRFPPDPKASSTRQSVMNKTPRLVPQLTDDYYEAAAQNSEHLALMKASGGKSLLIVPLVIGERSLGAISLGMVDSGRYYSEADLDLMSEVAHRAAFAVEHARLYRETEAARVRAQQAAERTNRLQEVTAALAGALTLADLSSTFINIATKATNAAGGTLALVSGAEALQIISVTGFDPEILQQWSSSAVDVPSPLAEAVQTRTPIWIESRADWLTRYNQPLTSPQYEAWCALPLTVNGSVMGGIGFGYAEADAFLDDDKNLLLAMATQCAQALDRANLYQAERRARDAAEKAQRHLEFLSSVSVALAQSLDYELTFQNLVHLILPEFADNYLVTVWNEHGALQSTAMAASDPQAEAALREMTQRYPPDAKGMSIRLTAQSGEPTFATDVSPELMVAYAQDAEHAALMRKVGARSYINAPLFIRDQVIGVLSLGMAESGRRYNAEDLPLVKELARRVALAIDHARLYQEAQDQRRRLQTTLSSIGDAVIATDIEGRLIFMNAVAETLTGWSMPEALGQDLQEVFQIINESTRLPVDNPVKQVIRQKNVLGLANRSLLITRTGVERPIDDSAAPILDEAGHLLGVILVFRDVSERRLLESAREHQLEHSWDLYQVSHKIGLARSPDEILKALLSSRFIAPCSQGAILTFSGSDSGAQPAAYDILATVQGDKPLPGFDPSLQLDHSPLLQIQGIEEPLFIADVDSDARLEAPLRQSLQASVIGSVALLPLTASGQRFGALVLYFSVAFQWTAESSRRLQIFSEQISVSIQNIRLLTTEAAARRDAEQANQLKLHFLAMISHELRTPLTSIKGFTSTLLSTDVSWDTPSQQGFLGIIDEEVDKLTDLVDQLLDLSRLTAGQLRVRTQRCEMGDILHIAKAQLEQLAVRHHLVLNLPPDLPPVMADPQRIAQVLGNLVGNAAKYAAPQSDITLSAFLSAQALQVNVSDTGPGIPAEARMKVFEAFRQIERADGQPLKGAGLGLAICKGLIEAHGGRIWIADQPPPGTTVSFTLPIT